MKNIYRYGIVLTTLLFSMVGLSQLDERIYSVSEVNVQTNSISLNDGYNARTSNFRVAFDAEIILPNGELGALANVRANDDVLVIFDSELGTANKIIVIKSAEGQ
jgi:hypothetical protein